MNVLLVTADTLRPDYMSMNGYDRPSTPQLDEILGRGYYFEQATSPIGRTTPALASLLSGAYPHTTGVRRLTDSLASDIVTLGERLEDAGYRTGAVVTNRVLGQKRGLGRGFERYDMAFDNRAAGATTDAALEQLEALAGSAPVLLWVHYIDPHVPYDSTAELAREMDPGYSGRYARRFGHWGRPGEPRSAHRTFPDDLPKKIATHQNPLPEEINAHIRRLYAADIRLLDGEVARLLDGVQARRPDDEWIFVFTADHGESLGEHGVHFDHGDYVYNAGTRVPLGIVLPAAHALSGSGRCRGWVSIVDVVPTLLELLSIAPGDAIAAQLEGRSLVPCMRGESLDAEPVFLESGFSYYPELVPARRRNDVSGRFRAVIRDDWKLVWIPFASEAESHELYDLAADPNETRDLYRPDHPRVGGLRADLERWLARAGAATDHPELSEQDRQALQALGYLEPDAPN